MAFRDRLSQARMGTSLQALTKSEDIQPHNLKIQNEIDDKNDDKNNQIFQFEHFSDSFCDYISFSTITIDLTKIHHTFRII